MISIRPQQARWILAVGDGTALLVVTLIGFRGHGTLATAGLRLPATVLPLWLSWFLVVPLLQLWKLPDSFRVKNFWRIPLAMLLAAPLASFLRGMILNASIAWIFVLVTGATGTLAILIWRILFTQLISPAGAADG